MLVRTMASASLASTWLTRVPISESWVKRKEGVSVRFKSDRVEAEPKLVPALARSDQLPESYPSE